MDVLCICLAAFRCQSDIECSRIKRYIRLSEIGIVLRFNLQLASVNLDRPKEFALWGGVESEVGGSIKQGLIHDRDQSPTSVLLLERQLVLD
jgi:hypothetical protein